MTKPIRIIILSLLIISFMASLSPAIHGQPYPGPGELLGADVGTNPEKLAINLKRMDTYAELGIRWVRIGMTPDVWWDRDKGVPTPGNADPHVNKAVRLGLKPYFLINFAPEAHGGSTGDFNWYETGRAFATHYRGRVECYTVFNEPDHTQLESITPEEMAAAIEEFCRGALEVDPGLLIGSGGMANMDWEHTGEYIKALAPMINDGRLKILNIHMYNSIVRDIRKVSTPEHPYAPNNAFRKLRDENGITANVMYACAEWSIRNRKHELDAVAAADFMTVLWDHMGVVGKLGNNDPKTLFAGMYQVSQARPDWAYGLADQAFPWVGNERGKVFELVLKLTRGMHFTQINPIGKGEFILDAPGHAKMWVYQNREGWKDGSPLTKITIEGIPDYAGVLEVWYWDGRTQVFVSPEETMEIDVRPGETVMIRALKDYWSHRESR